LSAGAPEQYCSAWGQLCQQTTPRGWHHQQTNGNGAKIEGKDLPM